MIAPIHGMCRRAGRGGAVANHLHEALLRRTVKADAPRVGIANRASPHIFRHSFPTPLLEESHDIRTVQELLGHRT